MMQSPFSIEKISGAIINNNDADRARYESERQNYFKTQEMQAQIDEIKSELTEIKYLLLKIIKDPNG